MTENEFAYPVSARVWLDENTLTEGLVGGLTKREVFAMAAMQGLMSSEPDRKPSSYASDAVDCADALMEALNKPKG